MSHIAMVASYWPYSGVARPSDLRDRSVDVVQQDLGHARAPTGGGVAEVGEPAVVRLEPFPAQLVLTRLGRRRDEVPAREERRNGVGKQDLGREAVAARLLESPVGIPVAVRRVTA